ncbi:unnamed protein product [Closterium sp. Naga37s-1]|nr:unnamed protein product [Closterium sp. Naga37s-1]
MALLTAPSRPTPYPPRTLICPAACLPRPVVSPTTPCRRFRALPTLLPLPGSPSRPTAMPAAAVPAAATPAAPAAAPALAVVPYRSRSRACRHHICRARTDAACACIDCTYVCASPALDAPTAVLRPAAPAIVPSRCTCIALYSRARNTHAAAPNARLPSLEAVPPTAPADRTFCPACRERLPQHLPRACRHACRCCPPLRLQPRDTS